MSQYYSSLKKRLEQSNAVNESEITEIEDSQLRRDIDKLRNLWKSVKENRVALDNVLADDEFDRLQSEDKRSPLPKNLLESLEDRVSFELTGGDQHYHPDMSRTLNATHQFEEQPTQTVKDKLRIAEEKLVKFQELNSSLAKKLSNAEEELRECHAKIAKQAYMNQMQSSELNEINHKTKSNYQANVVGLERYKEELEIARSALIEKQYEVDRLNLALKEKDNQISVVNNIKSMRFSQEIDSLLQENQILKRQLEKSKKDYDELCMLHRSEGAAILELERQKEDIRRLLTLLQSTEEFREFCSIEGIEPIRFLSKTKQTTLQKKPHKELYEKFKKEAQQEKTLWIPLEAFQFAHDFRLRFKGELTEQIVDDLLYELNKIWRAREESETKKLREKLDKEKKEMKRRFSAKFSHNEVTAKKEISRLRTLQRKKSPPSMTNEKSKIPLEVNLLNETVKNTIHNYKLVKTIEKENKDLNSRIRTLEDREVGVHEKKFIFLDGAKWMLNTMSKDFNLVIEQTANLHEEYDLKDPLKVDLDQIREEYSIAFKKVYLIKDGMDTIYSNFLSKAKKYRDKIHTLIEDAKLSVDETSKSP